MKVLVTLFSYQDRALDGSLIPRDAVEAYIKTSDWKEREAKKMALGGITHLDRNTSDTNEGLIGPDDRLLLNNNSTHCITKLYVKDDGFVWAEIEIFLSKGFDRETAEKIKKLKSLIRRGVKLPISVVVDAMWNTAEEARKIIAIRGGDWTLNPGYVGSEIKEIIQDDDDE